MRNFVKDKKNIIKALLVGYMAAFVLVMFAFCVKEVPVEEKKEQKVPEVTKINVKDIHYVKPVSTLKEISAAEEEGEFEPAPDKLNLAYIFPEDADESDSINSYAGKIYTAINALNASYYASYYDLTDTTPLSMASQYGLGASRVLGKYNPKDASHNPNNSSTWTVNQFKNVNVSFYDGDGNRINGYYDAQEVMALASVYAYYHDFTDAEAMEDYCRKLFDSAVTAKVSLGNVYYCSGCLNRTVEQEASEAIAIENQQAELENSLGDNSHGWIAVDASGQPTTRIYATTEATSSADENVVVSYGKSALQTIEVGTTAYENFGYAVANSDLTATIPASTSAASSGDGAGYASQYTETAQYTETQPYQTVQYSETAAASSEQYVQSTEYSENAVVSSGSGSSSVIISPETTAAAASYNSNADNQVVVSQGTASQGGAAQDASSQGGASQDASSGGFDTYVTPEPEITGEVIFESVYDGGVEYLNGDNSVDDQVVVSAGTGYQPETEAAQYDSGAAGASAASEASAEVTSGAVTSEASSETATAAASETAAEASDTSSNNSSETSGVIIASGSSTATAGRRPSVDEREVVSYGVSAAAEMSSAAAESEAAAAAAAAGYGNSEADQNGNAYNITGETLADGTVVYNNLSTVAAGETVSGMTGTGTTGTAGTAAGTSGTAGNSTVSVITGGSSGTTTKVTQSYCPGHIDVYVSITIRGIDDANGLFKIDPIGNDEANFNDKWHGWTDEMIALAKALYEQDWLENYGLSISSIKLNGPLTSEEIIQYLSTLPSTVSQTRKAIVEFALNSVGKVPYYWGGKPYGPGYQNNHFYQLIQADYRGRILRGLDCSGWINWVYWSVTGSSLAGESTGTLIGCGRKISRADLQPGDIIIRTGSDAHVVMFLCWAQNGNFIGIHETGGVTNNVTVAEMTASWPYYRALVD